MASRRRSLGFTAAALRREEGTSGTGEETSMNDDRLDRRAILSLKKNTCICGHKQWWTQDLVRTRAKS